MSIRDTLNAVGLEHIKGGSEQAVRDGVLKLPGITKRIDPSNSVRQLLKYSGKPSELPKNMPEFIKETIKGNKVGGVPDVAEIDDDETKELLKSVPKKVSHMG